MEYITAQAGKKMLCIEKERVEAILMKPEIWRVPDASEEILGIAVYNGKLVIYYRFDCKQEALCGILVRDDGGGIYGIAAAAVGEEGLSREELEPVMAGTVNGVWEKKSD